MIKLCSWCVFVNHNSFNGRTMKMFPLQVIATFVVAFAVPSRSIAGGENGLIEALPYQVSIEYMGFHVCGGSIVNNQIIMTAAHCLNGTTTEDLMVRAGSALVGRFGSMHQVTKVSIHQNFSRIGEVYVNDIALMHLETNIVFDDKRRETKLFMKGHKVEVGSEGRISGWGNTSYGKLTQLQVVVIPVVNLTICEKAYGVSLTGGHLCAGETGKGTCGGDDGGPMIVQDRLAGIASWGDACKKDGSDNPGVYTSVSFMRAWIDAIVDP